MSSLSDFDSGSDNPRRKANRSGLPSEHQLSKLFARAADRTADSNGDYNVLFRQVPYVWKKIDVQIKPHVLSVSEPLRLFSSLANFLRTAAS